MGSLEEDELVQMVQDFIESDHPPSPTSFFTSSNHHPLHNRSQYFILQVPFEFKFLKTKVFIFCSILYLAWHVLLCVLCFQDILRSDTSSTEAKVMKYVLKHMRGRHGSEKISSLNRWLVKRMRKDGLNASLYQTSWSTSLGCPAGGSFSTLYQNFKYNNYVIRTFCIEGVSDLWHVLNCWYLTSTRSRCIWLQSCFQFFYYG